MFEAIEIDGHLADLLGQVAKAVKSKVVDANGTNVNLKVPFAIVFDQVGDETRISVSPNPSISVENWVDPDLAFIGLSATPTGNQVGRVVAKGRLMTYVKNILRKP